LPDEIADNAVAMLMPIISGDRRFCILFYFPVTNPDYSQLDKPGHSLLSQKINLKRVLVNDAFNQPA